MNTSKRVELTVLVRHTERPSKSGILIYEVLAKMDRRIQVIAKRHVLQANAIYMGADKR